jgi:hypothetical protein
VAQKFCWLKKNTMENNKNSFSEDSKNTDQPSGIDRTTGRGGKESVSRSEDVSENEDLESTGQVDESLQNKLEQEDAGTDVDIEDDQRNEPNR